MVLTIATASRGGRSIRDNDVHVTHLRDGKIVEFWTTSTDHYTLDELIG